MIFRVLTKLRNGKCVVSGKLCTSLDRGRRNPDGDGKLTVPKTPNLETRRRLRPNTAVSQSDREEIELQEARM